MRPIILVPGYTGSGPDHWQTHWQSAYPCSRRVTVPDWDDPDLDTWVDALDQLVVSLDESAVLAAHSLGCYVVAHWADRTEREVAGALLVAPPDLARDDTEVPLKRFHPAPTHPIRFPTILAASTDDPYSSIQRAEELAEQWGSRFEPLGPAGHVNTAAGFGQWPEGEHYIRELMGSRPGPRLRQRPQTSAFSDSLL